MRRRPAKLIAAAAIIAMNSLLIGCTNGGATEPTPTETSTTSEATDPTTTASPETPEEKAASVLERYLKFRDNSRRAHDKPINFKRLNKFTTGQEFFSFQEFILENAEHQIRVVGEYGHAMSEPVVRDSSTIVIVDCEDVSSVELKDADGTTVTMGGVDNQPLPDAYKVEYQMEQQDDGRWLVADSAFVTAEDGVMETC